MRYTRALCCHIQRPEGRPLRAGEQWLSAGRQQTESTIPVPGRIAGAGTFT